MRDGRLQLRRRRANLPDKPIRLIVGFPRRPQRPDRAPARPPLGELLGQAVIIENRNGSMANRYRFVAKAPADGYTLLIASNGSISISPGLEKSCPTTRART